jgi:Zn-dependent protease
MVNLLLAVVLRNVSPTFALVNLVAFAYNMLPIPNSDGKRVLSILRAGTGGMSWSAHSYATQAVQPSRR